MEKTSNKYEHINHLVDRYQKGSKEAGLSIVQAFGYDPDISKTSWLIGKYFNLLRYGSFKFRNKDTRRFIRLFMTNEEYKTEMIRNYQYSDTKKASRKIVQTINYRMSSLSDEEIIHDLSLVLLTMADRYVKKGTRNNFCAYVSSSYHFYVYRYYKYLFKDLIYSHRIEPFEDYIDENNEVIIKDSWDYDLYFENEKHELGFNWILGRSASYPFNKLTQFERTIISLYDHKGMTYDQIASQTGYHKDTIWRKRKEIKDKIKKLLENRKDEF